MKSDQSKLFVGGIWRETSEHDLKEHFEAYGSVSGSNVARDRCTKISRGFGFVWFCDRSSADRALQGKHVIMGRTEEAVENVMKKSFHELSDSFVEVKRAIPKEVKNTTYYNNSIIGVKDVRVSVDNNAVQIPGDYLFMGPSFSSVPLQGEQPCYARVVGNVYGSWYPMGGVYSGTGYGAPPFMHRGVLFNPRMMGTRMWQLPHASAPNHRAYWNSGIGNLGIVADS